MYTTPNRRTFLKTTAAAFAALLIDPTHVFADFNGLIDGMMHDAKTDKVTVTPLGQNIYVIENTGGNITVLDTPEGKLLVDAGIGNAHPHIAEALAGISPTPVKEILTTHYHFDHAGGNAWLHETGARVSAHPNTKKHMLVPTTVTPWRYTFPPAPAAGLPTQLVETTTILTLNGVHLEARHTPHAHTDGDLVAFFREPNVLSTGDTFWNGYYPFIDCESGGDIRGMIKATRENLALANDTTKIVPGHGPIATKDDLQEYHDMLVGVRNAVQRLKLKNMSVEQAVAAKPSAPWDAKWGHYAVSPDDFVRLVFQELPGDHFDN